MKLSIALCSIGILGLTLVPFGCTNRPENQKTCESACANILEFEMKEKLKTAKDLPESEQEGVQEELDAQKDTLQSKCVSSCMTSSVKKACECFIAAAKYKDYDKCRRQYEKESMEPVDDDPILDEVKKKEESDDDEKAVDTKKKTDEKPKE